MFENLQNKKIAILGMGVNNLKLADYLKAKGIAFEVVDGWKTPTELVGKLDNYEIVFRTPGLPYLSEPLQQAQSKGVEITSQTKLFFQLCPAPIIGVTGTKGKGTTASLIAKILEASGRKVWLAGNIGRDPFEFLDNIQAHDSVVMELSSFQLQDLDRSPHIAVVLNITSDHLTHHKTVEEYMHAKLSIVSHQTSADFAVLDSRLPDWFRNAGDAEKIFFDPQTATDYKTQLIGKHYLENIAAAVETAKLMDVDETVIKNAVASFEPLPHRMKIVREVQWCYVYR
jgi:UDP-N-acetylmuramoylalanine--D-glutamate ligase